MTEFGKPIHGENVYREIRALHESGAIKEGTLVRITVPGWSTPFILPLVNSNARGMDGHYQVVIGGARYYLGDYANGYGGGTGIRGHDWTLEFEDTRTAFDRLEDGTYVHRDFIQNGSTGLVLSKSEGQWSVDKMGRSPIYATAEQVARDWFREQMIRRLKVEEVEVG